jgi:hypothetical protein
MLPSPSLLKKKEEEEEEKKKKKKRKKKTWEKFRTWFSGLGFQDLGSQLWGLDFHTRGFQDRNLKTFRT